MVCNNCNNSDKESFLLLKGYKVKNNNNCPKQDNKKQQMITTSDDNNNSTNNLEIIDYPYSINYNQDETFPINPTDINIKTDLNYEFLNNVIKKENFMEDGFNEKNHISRNINQITLNNSSGIINNEDSITQNKILLKNLYSNYNKNIGSYENNNNNENNKKDIDNNTKDSNIEKKNENNNKNLKLYNIEKNKITYKNNHNNMIGVKVEYPSPDTENFISKSNNLIPSQTKKIVKKINFNLKKYQKSSTNKTEDLKNKNIKTKNITVNVNNININTKKIKVNINRNSVTKIDSKAKLKTINTFKLYRKTKIKALNKQKINNNTGNNNSKRKNITLSRRTTVEYIKKYKPYLNFKLANKTINTSAPITKKNYFTTFKENHKKSPPNKFNQSNYNDRTLLGYSEKSYKYTNLMNLRKRRNEEYALTSKIYLNPFDTVEKKALNHFKIKIQKKSKIKIK